MPENKTFLKEVSLALIVTSISFVASIGLQIARPIARNKLYKKLIYWRPIVSKAVVGTYTFNCYMVINESCFETDGDVDFSFKLYKGKNVEVIISEEQKNSTPHINDSKSSKEQLENKRIYLGSPDEKTIFTLKPKKRLDSEGWQTVNAKRTVRLSMNEATCVAVVLWDYPPKQAPQEFNLFVDHRKCKSYSEYVTYKNYLKTLKEVFYFVFWLVLFITFFGAGITFNKWREYKKYKKRRRQEDSIEDTIENL